MKWRLLVILLGSCILILVAIGVCKKLLSGAKVSSSVSSSNGTNHSVTATSARAIALAPHSGDEPIDRDIRSLQKQARSKPEVDEVMIRLGWKFITKARLTCDPGYYKLAEACAFCVESRKADDPDALLLHGHILQSLHKFKEGEPIARKLVALRNQSSDFGLLGDLLMEQGKLNPAIDAYQEMMNLRPDPEAYTRAAHMRWLRGDLDGAIEMIQMAASAASPREPEPGAWAYTRLGIYSLQAGRLDIAERSAWFALQYVNDYPPALLLRGRVLLAQSRTSVAIESLQQAATLNPLPEFQWILADALREAGKTQAAEEVENKLVSAGDVNDPRTFALFLATRRTQLERSLQLAFDELKTREDVFTMDALAWALRANGRVAEALEYSRKSLTEGTQDGRLFYHAGCTAMDSGHYAEAAELFAHADEIKQTLFPSERSDFAKQYAALKEIEASRPMAQQSTPKTAN
jgi:tetratricopeptide (TPR) repeat protein